ncbi:hypothetical protein Dimus_004580 [Dionaea muscipula]
MASFITPTHAVESVRKKTAMKSHRDSVPCAMRAFFSDKEMEVADVLVHFSDADAILSRDSVNPFGLPPAWPAKKKRSLPPDDSSPSPPSHSPPEPLLSRGCDGATTTTTTSPSTPLGLGLYFSSGESDCKSKDRPLKRSKSKTKPQSQQILADFTEQNNSLNLPSVYTKEKDDEFRLEAYCGPISQNHTTAAAAAAAASSSTNPYIAALATSASTTTQVPPPSYYNYPHVRGIGCGGVLWVPHPSVRLLPDLNLSALPDRRHQEGREAVIMECSRPEMTNQERAAEARRKRGEIIKKMRSIKSKRLPPPGAGRKN